MNIAMDTAVIRERLHEYIEVADSEHLAAIYILLQKEMPERTQYDAETLSMLYRRLEEDLAGKSKFYTVSEAFASVRNNKR